ncbi:MAG: hypothetical protein PHF51_02425 [Candidatus ainarchaeum sp.]|nr:hypothetical protein [Candidatus ainarchaeum sp.]
MLLGDFFGGKASQMEKEGKNALEMGEEKAQAPEAQDEEESGRALRLNRARALSPKMAGY